ncbi:MAG: ABC transporter ATP-binding protein [Deltaproteobacteria bacterium]|nr:MAG: ABC transporter ATP-binding protein [Deltaproteobacteria bacterium]
MVAARRAWTAASPPRPRGAALGPARRRALGGPGRPLRGPRGLWARAAGRPNLRHGAGFLGGCLRSAWRLGTRGLCGCGPRLWPPPTTGLRLGVRRSLLSQAPAASIQGVHRSFGRVRAVIDINLQIPRGHFVGLIGHNGAGKSTLLRMMIGLLRPDRGTIRVGGIDVHADPLNARRKIGAVPEQPAVYEYLTAREWLDFVADVRGGADQIEDLLQLLDLAGDADRLIREFSQGMRRKAALAAALLGDPELIVLDESLNGLDPPSSARVKGLLRAKVDAGASVLLSTHVVDTVERVADRVVMLAHGRVVADELASDLPAGGLEALFLERLEQTRRSGPEA